jgi:SAM-dependent methyltransferase
MRRKHKEATEYAREGYDNASRAVAQYDPHVSLADKTVLDAGCGLGGKTVYYSEQDTRYVIGVDFDDTHVSHARHFAETRNAEKVRFLVAGLARLPLPQNSFDLIFLNDVVEHIPRPVLRDSFLECRRVLKPGGKICLQFPPWSCYNASHLYHYISVPWCHLIFSEETLVRVTKRYEPQPRIGSLSYIEHFRQLNRIELDEFQTIVADSGLRTLDIERRMIKGLEILKFLPILRRFLTTRIVAVLTTDSQ